MCVLCALVGLCLVGRVPRANASSTHRTSLVLDAQTDWVDPGGQFKMTLTIRSDLPLSDLGLKLVLYGQLASVTAFDETLVGREPAGELPLFATSVIPLTSISDRPASLGRVSLELGVSTSATSTGRSSTSPTLPLDCQPGSCAGVYPLEVAVVNMAAKLEKPLASLTSHLCYISNQQGSLPLRVALVLPLGEDIALGPDGQSTLSSKQVVSLTHVIDAISVLPHEPLSLELYPQLLVALSNDPKTRALYSKLVTYVRTHQAVNLEVLQAPFAPVDPSVLSSKGLQRDFAVQLTRGASQLEGVLGVAPQPNPFVSYAILNNGALQLLARQDIDEIVLPDTSVVNHEMTTPTDPFELALNAQSNSSALEALPHVVGLVSNSQLSTRFAKPGNDVVLVAHQFLAELAQIYFDLPGARQARGIVVVPQLTPSSTLFLRTVLNGLRSSSILSPSTVGALFSTLSVGANGEPRDLSLAEQRINAGSLTARAVNRAYASLNTVTSIAPSDSALLSSLGDSVLLGESTNLSSDVRAELLAAPGAELDVMRSSLGLSGTKSITLTSLTGTIPITISYSGAPGPMHVDLKMSSSELTFPSGASRELVLTKKDTALEVKVSTRTSGSFPLRIELTSPSGDVQLFVGTFTVRSRAVTGVAIALSLGALVVLALWWMRSFARRRRRSRRHVTPSVESGRAATP